jgi:hypothetical protein
MESLNANQSFLKPSKKNRRPLHHQPEWNKSLLEPSVQQMSIVLK